MDKDIEKLTNLVEDTNKKVTELYDKMQEAEGSELTDIMKKWSAFYFASLVADRVLKQPQPPASFL